MRVSAYPWASLERLPRAAWREAGRARRALARAITVDALGRAASEVLSVETALVLGDVSVDVFPTNADTVAFETSDGSLVMVALDAALISGLLGRVLGRPVGLTAPGTPLDATVAGALAALLGEIARRSGAPEAFGDFESRATRGGLRERLGDGRVRRTALFGARVDPRQRATGAAGQLGLPG